MNIFKLILRTSTIMHTVTARTRLKKNLKISNNKASSTKSVYNYGKI